MKKLHAFIITLVGLAVAALIISYNSFFIVNPGFTALQMRMGKFITSYDVSGCYVKMPFVDSVVLINNRINKAEIETSALSKDLQTVSIGMVINYRVKDARSLYQTVGTQFEQVIINPFTQESVKAIVAKFTAEDLIQCRHDAKDKVIAELASRLAPMHLILVDFNFIHLDFSKDFIHAVEEKQIAEQSAKTAKNLTEKVKEEALQIRSKAEAEAFSLKVKKESVNADLIALKQVEILAKAIEKWDGVLPKVTTNGTPFFNVGNAVQ